MTKIDSDVSYAYGRIAELAATDGIEINLAQMVTPDWMTDAIEPMEQSSDKERFQAWRAEQGYISDDDDFELRGQPPDELDD